MDVSSGSRSSEQQVRTVFPRLLSCSVVERVASQHRPSCVSQAKLIEKSAMNVAMAPGSQLFMTGFMLWMSGSALGIFSIMTLGMALFQPIRRLFGVSTAFARYKDSKVDLTKPKLIFIGLNLLGIGRLCVCVSCVRCVQPVFQI